MSLKVLVFMVLPYLQGARITAGSSDYGLHSEDGNNRFSGVTDRTAGLSIPPKHHGFRKNPQISKCKTTTDVTDFKSRGVDFKDRQKQRPFYTTRSKRKRESNFNDFHANTWDDFGDINSDSWGNLDAFNSYTWGGLGDFNRNAKGDFDSVRRKSWADFRERVKKSRQEFIERVKENREEYEFSKENWEKFNNFKSNSWTHFNDFGSMVRTRFNDYSSIKLGNDFWSDTKHDSWQGTGSNSKDSSDYISTSTKTELENKPQADLPSKSTIYIFRSSRNSSNSTDLAGNTYWDRSMHNKSLNSVNGYDNAVYEDSRTLNLTDSSNKKINNSNFSGDSNSVFGHHDSHIVDNSSENVDFDSITNKAQSTIHNDSEPTSMKDKNDRKAGNSNIFVSVITDNVYFGSNASNRENSRRKVNNKDSEFTNSSKSNGSKGGEKVITAVINDKNNNEEKRTINSQNGNDKGGNNNKIYERAYNKNDDDVMGNDDKRSKMNKSNKRRKKNKNKDDDSQQDNTSSNDTDWNYISKRVLIGIAIILLLCLIKIGSFRCTVKLDNDMDLSD